MLNVVKYTDGNALVVIYKNFVQLDNEAKLDILENIADAETFAIANVKTSEPLQETDVEVKVSTVNSVKDLIKEMAKPKDSRDEYGICKYVRTVIDTINPDVFAKYSKNQSTLFIEAFGSLCSHTFMKVLFKMYGYEDAKSFIANAKTEEIIEAQKEIVEYLKESKEYGEEN